MTEGYQSFENTTVAEDSISDGLEYEKELIFNNFRRLRKDYLHTEEYTLKNVELSEQLRAQGNAYLKSENHNLLKHSRALNYYTKSIAYAPHNTECQAQAYLSRSTLLLHLSKFQECLQDCDNGLNISAAPAHLKATFKCRRIECLIALCHRSSEAECKAAITYVDNLSELDEELKKGYKNRFNQYMQFIKSMEFVDTSETSQDIYMKFDKQPQVPCASRSITIQHDNRWGRHIVATQDIQPGEVIAVEKCYFAIPHRREVYQCCSYCMQCTWTLIPCESCVYNMYCSDICKKKAWESYHMYECCIFPKSWDTVRDAQLSLASIRLLLVSIDKAGGIDQLKNQLISVQQCADPCTKGFSNGIFDSQEPRTIYGLSTGKDKVDKRLIPIISKTALEAVFYLATKTDLFGKKYNTSFKEIFENKYAVFVGALIIRNYLLLPCNSFLYNAYYESTEGFEVLGDGLFPYCSLFNHSCYPNAEYLTTKNYELVVYAKYPIRSGTQIFIAYGNNDYVNSKRSERMASLKNSYYFICNCVACRDDLTSRDLVFELPSLEETNPDLYMEIDLEYNLLLKDLTTSAADSSEEDSDHLIPVQYCLEFLERIRWVLIKFEENIPTYCVEYENLFEYVTEMFLSSFGNKYIQIPSTC